MRRPWAVVVAIVLGAGVSACGGLSRHTDGPLTTYLAQPIPELPRPLARTLSVEIVTYQTAASDKATMVSDLIGREVYILPGDVGEEVGELLKMDVAFSAEATMSALDTIAKNRSKARNASTLRRAKDAPTTLAPAGVETERTSGDGPAPSWTVDASTGAEAQTTAYVQKQETLAKQASARGDHAMAEVHYAAAANHLAASQAMDRAVSSSQALASGMQAAHSAGIGIIGGQFEDVRRWIEAESGAVGPAAPEGTHLSVFLLEYFDAAWGRLDSRMRAAVLLVLVDADGRTTTVLEGSDVLTCAGRCNVFVPKPTSRPIQMDAVSDDVLHEVLGLDGLEARKADGFRNLSGIYQYLLLRHALAKLEGKTAVDEGRQDGEWS